MVSRWTALVLLVACKKGDDGPAECRDGFETGGDGLCYEIRDPGTGDEPLQAVFDDLPACELLTPDGQLDLLALCAGPGCATFTYSELESGFGNGQCDSIGGGRAECEWSDWGVIGNYLDPDEDGRVDDDQLATGLFVDDRFPGATAEGLGPGISISCFLDVLGLPTSLEPTEEGGRVWVFWWGFDFGRFYLIDYLGDDGPGGDGIAEYVWLNGPA